MWGFQHYLFVGISNIQAGFEKEQWCGMGGLYMMTYTVIGSDV